MKRLLLVLLFLPALSFADDYTYWYFGYGIFYQDLGSAKQAFESIYPCTTGHDGYVSCEYRYPERNGPSQISACLYRTYENGKGSNACPVVIEKRTGSCPLDQVFDFTLQQCTSEPEPDQCEAGKETSVFKFVPNDTVISYPPTGCLAGCTFVYTSSTPCWYPYVKGDVLGSNCKITYTGTGEECNGGDDPDSPPDVPPDSENPPDGPPNPDCKRFVNADGSWGYDCNPKPDPDENNNCPPGYMIQGDTCFRIPPIIPTMTKIKTPKSPATVTVTKTLMAPAALAGLRASLKKKHFKILKRV